ncbi:MAG: aminotransferase class III-fold pyridoxal phosphate-dependent enzyme [Lentisphaerae bacterium]|nr:aminotransferase class III-fold pyridoxal phosphate-dependent enzyme [Lentisphaerota bacterium]
MDPWTLTALDKLTAKELQAGLPPKMFDAHAHLYRAKDIQHDAKKFKDKFNEHPLVTTALWREKVGGQVGASRLVGGLFMPIPSSPAMVKAANDFLLSQLELETDSRGQILVSPKDPREQVLKHLEHPRVIGFKPYHLLSGLKNSYEARLSQYLPEWTWALAQERGLFITLHMVRSASLSDPDNWKTIRAMCQKYPGVRLILAHSARGFNPATVTAAIGKLRGLENIWFDSSCVCESAATLAILEEFGPRKLLWGSDFPCDMPRGKCVSAGDSFVWLNPKTLPWAKIKPTCRPILIGLEALRALKAATDLAHLNKDDIRDIYCDNALRLFGLKTESGTLTQDLYRHGKERIPGGVQLLSKRPEMFAPDQWPAYFREARGCETWDLDGRRYLDFSINGIGTCLLGFRDPDVTRAVQRRIAYGCQSTLNPPEEVELADLLCQIHPWAEQARFARTGGEVAAVAVRIARATTDRSVVAVCGYHGWQDWYLAANLGDTDALRGLLLPGLDPLGVPRELRGSTRAFHFNNRQEFQAIADECGKNLAAVVMEPCRNMDPEPGFLEFVRDLTHRCGGLLIFDEITIGWRLHLGGSHLRFGINPDMAIFAKTMGNGHPMAAVIGTRAAMAGAHTSFISSSNWTESVGPAAAVATLGKMMRVDVRKHVARIGAQVMECWKQRAAQHGLPVVVTPGYPCVPQFRFEHELGNELKTLYIQLMLEQGFLAGTLFYPTLAHTDDIVAQFDRALDKMFAEIAGIVGRGKIKESLKGPPAHTGFRRLI